MKTIKHILAPLMACAISLVAIPGWTDASDSPGVALDQMVAVVNQDIILQSELNAEASRLAVDLRSQGIELPDENSFRSQVLEQLIIKKIQLQRAKSLGLSVDDVAINQTLERIAQSNQLQLSELPAALQSQGLDYNDYRQTIREEIIIEQLRNRDVLARIDIPAAEIAQAQQALMGNQIEYRVQHILLSNETQSSKAAAQQAQTLYQRLQSGAAIKPLAVAYSSAPDALEGGDLGWRTLVQLPTIFVKPTKQLKPGEVSEPFETRSGWHIIKLDGIRNPNEEPVYATQWRARHILLADRLDAEAQLAELKQQIEEGADFAELAQLRSQDPGSSGQGGELGWTSPGRLVPEFEQQLAALQPGELSEPFQSQYGWHLVELLETRQADISSETTKQKVFVALRQRKAAEETEQWIRRLRDDAYVNIL